MSFKKFIPIIISGILTIAIIVVGVVFAGTEPAKVTDNTPPETTPPVTEPVKALNVPEGTYYYIFGTHTEYNGDMESLAGIVLQYPTFIIKDNTYVFTVFAREVFGTAHSEGNNIIFDKPENIQASYPIDTEHDETWYKTYYPQQTKAWSCTYDEATKTITISHNSDFVEFRAFATPEEYVEYIRTTYGRDTYFSIYPTPHFSDGAISDGTDSEAEY